MNIAEGQEGLKLMKCDYLENVMTVQLNSPWATFLMQKFLFLKWK